MLPTYNLVSRFLDIETPPSPLNFLTMEVGLHFWNLERNQISHDKNQSSIISVIICLHGWWESFESRFLIIFRSSASKNRLGFLGIYCFPTFFSFFPRCHCPARWPVGSVTFFDGSLTPVSVIGWPNRRWWKCPIMITLFFSLSLSHDSLFIWCTFGIRFPFIIDYRLATYLFENIN